METGSELSKTVAIFIVQKILLDDLGLQYICQTYERFYAVGAVLGNMVTTLVETQAVRLLKHVVRCYLRMSDNPRCVFRFVWHGGVGVEVGGAELRGGRSGGWSAKAHVRGNWQWSCTQSRLCEGDRMGKLAAGGTRRGD